MSFANEMFSFMSRFFISHLPRFLPFYPCCLVLDVAPVMTDVWKWPAARELVIGLVPRLYVSRVSGAASANEPKERNSRNGGLVCYHERNFILLAWQGGK